MEKQSRVSRYEWAWCVAFAVAAALMLSTAARVLRPAREAFGSTWNAYLAEPRNTVDVLFLGSSYAYCDWNPGAMYDESGLTGYVMAGGEQTVGVTYYYLKEALKTQSPRVVVMEGSSLFFDRYESFTQINVGYMPWGLNKLGAIREYSEPEKREGLLLDLIFYHDRWKELTRADLLQAVPVRRADHLKGHTAMDGVYDGVAGGGPYRGPMRQTEEIYTRNLEDFARLGTLCRERGIDLIVAVNPTYSQYTPEVYQRLEEDVLARGATRFANWADSFAEVGLDPRKHLYDGGHLNQEGAKVFSRYTGNYLLSLGYQPRPQRDRTAAAWRETAEYWNR